MSNATTCGAPPERSGSEWTPERLAEAFSVSRETLDRLEAYVALLVKWQRRINLIGPGTVADIWGRHIADSLQLASLAPRTARTWLDLGTGAGLPGLVVAIALAGRPSLIVHLVEANARKCAFLRTAAAAIAAPVRVHHARIESLATQPDRPRPDVITARALAPLDKLLAMAEPFMGENAVLILPRGQDIESELTQTSISWRIKWTAVPSRVEPSATILCIEEAIRHAQ